MSERFESKLSLPKVESATVDFGEGVFSGGIEKPYNAAVELANAVAKSHLPEIHLVNEKALDHTTAGKIGNIVGQVADVAALTAATGLVGEALGGAAMVNLTLGKSAAIFAIENGMFRKSPDGTRNIIDDRIKSGAAGAVLGAVAGGLAARFLPPL